MAIVVGDVVALHLESAALVSLIGMKDIPLFGLVTAIDVATSARTVVWENGLTATVAAAGVLLDKIEQASSADRDAFEGKVVNFSPAAVGGGYVSAEQSGPVARVYIRDPEDANTPNTYVAWVAAPGGRAYENRVANVVVIPDR